MGQEPLAPTARGKPPDSLSSLPSRRPQSTWVAMANAESGRIPERERAGYDRQMRIGHLAFFGIGPAAVVFMRILRANRFEGFREVRRLYREAAESGRPVIVCANHLTMFDSVFIHHALASLPQYFREFRLFTWNVPAVENFKRDPFLRALTYLAKTIPI